MIPANIDAIRAIACIFVVAYHVIGGSPGTGLRLPPESGWHWLVDLGALFRMPAFAIMSGVVYQQNLAGRSGALGLLRRQSKKLIVPFIVATIATLLLRHIFRADRTSLFSALFWPYESFWFLQSIIDVFIFMAVIQTMFLPRTWVLAIIAVVAAIMSWYGVVTTSFFSLNSSIYLLPFFLSGMIVRSRIAEIKDAKYLTLIVAAVTTSVFAWQLYCLVDGRPWLGRSHPLAMLAGLTSTILLLKSLPAFGPLTWIGHRSFAIYLWHVAALSCARTLTMHIIDLGTGAQFCIGLGMGVGVPLFGHWFVWTYVRPLAAYVGVADPRRRPGQ